MNVAACRKLRGHSTNDLIKEILMPMDKIERISKNLKIDQNNNSIPFLYIIDVLHI